MITNNLIYVKHILKKNQNSIKYVVTLREICQDLEVDQIKSLFKEKFEHQGVSEYLVDLCEGILDLIKNSEYIEPEPKEYLHIKIDRFGILEFFVINKDGNEKSPLEYHEWNKLFNMNIKIPYGTNSTKEKYICYFIADLCFYGYPEQECKRKLNELFFFKIEKRNESIKRMYQGLFMRIKSMRKKVENYPPFQ